MTRLTSPGKSCDDARLLFTLLDAIESDGRMVGTPFLAPWSAVKARINSGGAYEAESENFYELLVAIDGAGLISGTWMENRWHTTVARIHHPH